MSSMGRPRVHDEQTRAELLDTAERLVAEGGIEAVSVRAAAMGAGTTTRAVYVLFGSKEELVQALAQRAFGLLMEQVAAVPLTGDPGRDLIVCSVKGFRAFALEHPDLFRLFFTAQLPRPPLSTGSTRTRMTALEQLALLVERAQVAGLLGSHSVEEVTLLWDALCTGLAMREICGPIQRSEGERIWTDALTALLRGLGPGDGAQPSATDKGASPRAGSATSTRASPITVPRRTTPPDRVSTGVHPPSAGAAPWR
jgi:AcrR family transcriptional regulator